MSRVLVVGLDGLSPTLVQTWLPELPNLRGVMERGIFGAAQSIVQPVTPPAWTAMISGRNPGHFGFTDFTYRVDQSYTEFKLIHSRQVRVPTLYTLLPAAGRRALFVSVPVTYPPVTIPDGLCLSCFMAPSVSSGITQPAEAQADLLARTTSPFLLDASADEASAGVDRGDLARRIRELDRQRFDIAAHLMQTRPWDLLFMVCMGTDRAAHYFMRYQDPAHGRHDPDPRYRDVIRDHYRYCDERLGELLALAGEDTVVMVVSDHGVQRLDGKVNINDWLFDNGYLRLESPVDKPTPLARAAVDWSRTRAWARGYGGQVYLNVRGREPEGCVEPEAVDALMDELSARLKELTAPDGGRLRVDVMRRRDIYSGPQAAACPDLFLQVEGLRYLTSDLLGHRGLVTPVRELALDDASHAPAGFLALCGPGVPRLGRFNALYILDVAPTVLDLLGVPLPPDLDGRPIHKVDDVYSSEDEAALTSRLQALYLE
jgi:predicted AlkP superfamily phosphohydrolase/phosphomutase